jgi:V8-like Glu-specific endopeptidase
MTAGHNIIDVNKEKANGIEINFPNGLKFNVSPEECFVSKVYGENPVNSSEAASSFYDYGLIVTDRSKHLAQSGLDPGGCAFSALLADVIMRELNASVYGYSKGNVDQVMNASKLDHLNNIALFYRKNTTGGVSGGPIFVSLHGVHTAIGIQ